MMKIKIFKNSFIQTLSGDIKKNIDMYRSGNFDWTLEVENGQNYFELEAPWFNEAALIALNNVSGVELDDVADPRDATIVYQALKSMPPEVARDARIWATLCHTHCLKYVRQRNHRFLFTPEIDEAINFVKSRFFIEGMRSYERTNGLARLWWFGFLVDQTNLPFKDAIETQLIYTDFRAGTIERPEVFSHKEIRSAVLDVAINLKSKGDEFYKNRVEYRTVFKDVNERATRIFFPAMSHERLTKFVSARIDRVRQKS
jgi:hypothetical protein